jgi:amino acid transporter
MRDTDQQKLTRLGALPLAFGSIAGSGLLTLPSAVYADAGSNASVVWLVAMALCVPMLIMFREMVKAAPGGDPLRDFVVRSLGPPFGDALPLMYLFVVILGLPTGAAVSGEYVAGALGTPQLASPIAALVIVVALAVNAIGGRANDRLQLTGAWSLTAIAGFLVALSFAHARRSVPVIPDAALGSMLFRNVLLAFWAFVGFENLTFLSRELHDPERDYMSVNVLALGLYGALTMLLTFALGAQFAPADVSPVTGLLQLASGERESLLKLAIAAIGLFATVINAAAWMRGVAALVVNAAASGLLPAGLSQRRAAIPLRALALLGTLCSVSFFLLAWRPDLIVDALVASCAVFVAIYVICIVAYVRHSGLTTSAIANAGLLPIMAASLWQSGGRSIYAAIVVLGALGWSALLNLRSRSNMPMAGDDRGRQ